jgi:plasmid maintenance system antidote protein VapI
MPEKDETLKLQQYVEELKNDPEFIADGLSLKVVEEMLEILEKEGHNQSWLGEKMGVSRAHISKILNAAPNMTFLTLAKIAVALGTKPYVCLNSEDYFPASQSQADRMNAGTASFSRINSALVTTNAGIEKESGSYTAAE